MYKCDIVQNVWWYTYGTIVCPYSIAKLGSEKTRCHERSKAKLKHNNNMPASSISAQLLFRSIPLAWCMSVGNSVFFVERHNAQLLATTLSPASTRNEVWKWFPMHFPFESLIHKFHRLSKRWLKTKSVKTLVGWVAKTSPMKPAITRLPVISCGLRQFKTLEAWNMLL